MLTVCQNYQYLRLKFKKKLPSLLVIIHSDLARILIHTCNSLGQLWLLFFYCSIIICLRYRWREAETQHTRTKSTVRL